MAFIDYYQILGIAKNATEKEVKAAYRKLARKHHPDVNPNDKNAQQKFQEVNEANEVLSDPDKRKKYDQYGKDWKHADQFESAKKSQNSSSAGYGGQRRSSDFGESESDYSDFFASMFGGGSQGSGRTSQAKFRGQDFNAEVQLNFRDAYRTHQQSFNINGKNIRITIPAGIDHAQTIKIKGYGGLGVNNGPNGDLYITFNIGNDPEFKRVGSDLYLQKKIDLYTAVLGGDIQIETLSGKVKLHVNPGTQSGSKVKLKGKGFPVYKKEGEFGDLFVTYQIQIPESLTKRQKELFMELSTL